MPKLSSAAIEKRKEMIEDAARELFIKQGFHRTSMRDIAKGAEVSLGNLYNYYATKDAIFESLINGYVTVIDDKLRSIFSEIDEPLEPENLRRLGELVGKLVNEHSDFWLLMYIDVLEFENRHFRKMFENIAQKLRRRFANSFDDLKRKNVLHDGVDPAIGFTAAYMQFFNYFIVEKLFGGNMHFGISDEQVIERLTDIYSRGLLRGSHPVKRSVNKRRTTSTPQRSRKRTSR